MTLLPSHTATNKCNILCVCIT